MNEQQIGSTLGYLFCTLTIIGYSIAGFLLALIVYIYFHTPNPVLHAIGIGIATAIGVGIGTIVAQRSCK